MTQLSIFLSINVHIKQGNSTKVISKELIPLTTLVIWWWFISGLWLRPPYSFEREPAESIKKTIFNIGQRISIAIKLFNIGFTSFRYGVGLVG